MVEPLLFLPMCVYVQMYMYVWMHVCITRPNPKTLTRGVGGLEA